LAGSFSVRRIDAELSAAPKRPSRYPPNDSAFAIGGAER
jgi:hypothetical protein